MAGLNQKLKRKKELRVLIFSPTHALLLTVYQEARCYDPLYIFWEMTTSPVSNVSFIYNDADNVATPIW